MLDQFKNKTPFSKHLTSLIKYADFGISDVKSVPANIPSDIWHQFKEQMKTQIGADEGKLEEAFNIKNATQLQFTHTGEDSSSAGFGLDNESRAPSPRCRSSRLPFVSYQGPRSHLSTKLTQACTQPW